MTMLMSLGIPQCDGVAVTGLLQLPRGAKPYWRQVLKAAYGALSFAARSFRN